MRLLQPGLDLGDLLGRLRLQLLDGALLGRELGFQGGQPLAPAAVARRQLRELARRLGFPARARPPDARPPRSSAAPLAPSVRSAGRTTAALARPSGAPAPRIPIAPWR